MVPPKFCPGCGAQHNGNTKNINHKIDNGTTKMFHHLDADFCSSSTEVLAKRIDDISYQDSPKDTLHWYGPDDGTTSQQSGWLWWGLPWLHPGGADRAAWQFLQSPQHVCCCYWSLHAILSCSACGQICHHQQKPAHPLQRHQQQQQLEHQHRLHWEYGISRWKFQWRGCNVIWWFEMGSVIGCRISIVCYLILGFVDIS